MSTIISSIKRFYQNYRGETIISAVSSIATVIASIFLTLAFGFEDPYLVGFYAFGVITVLLLLGLLFNQKRLVEKRLKTSDRLIRDLIGPLTVDNLFFRRRMHYTHEKQLLARVTVQQVLPRLIRQIYGEHTNLKRLNLIIDSGTTLTPIFPLLVMQGIPRKNDVELGIYTNSMSGIEEIHKMNMPENCPLNERDFNLIGGQPLRQYRATTGQVTQNFLKSLWAEADQYDEGEVVTLAVLTANWFLTGPGYDRLSICARGSGHFDFKKDVAEHSDYRLVVTPLGKLLHLSAVDELNELLKDQLGPDYRGFELSTSSENKQRTLLLTTRRSQGSLSPFRNLTIKLDQIWERDSAQNFALCDDCAPYEPPGESIPEVYAVETPNVHVRVRFEGAYGFAPVA